MSRKNDAGRSQNNGMTLAEQVAGAKALAHLARLVARLIIEIVKLIKTYQSATSRPLPENAIG